MISSGSGTRTRLSAASLLSTSFDDRIQPHGGIGTRQRRDEGHRGKQGRN
jgi:hypothetical protein